MILKTIFTFFLLTLSHLSQAVSFNNEILYPSVIDFGNLEYQGINCKKEEVINSLNNKTIIGLVHKDLRFVYSAILDWVAQYRNSDIQFILVDENFENHASVEILHGLIFPGSNDTYPKEQDHVKLQDITLPNKDEQLYIKYYQLADYYRIPTFGICAGAQHLTLARNGMVAPVKTVIRSSWESFLLGLNYLLFDKKFFTSIESYTWMHFLSLDAESQKELLQSCHAPLIEDIEIKRMHSFYPMQEFLGDGVELAGSSDDMPMAFSYRYWNFATQFHPEHHVWIEDQEDPFDWLFDRLFESKHKESARITKNMLGGFLSLCVDYHNSIAEAKKKDLSRNDGVDAWAFKQELIDQRMRDCKTRSVTHH